MSKIIKFNPESINSLKKGVDTLANAVKCTLGPKGNTVILDKKFGTPHITKDGISVAKEVSVKDPIENMGVQLGLEISSQTAEQAGDGTTTSLVLAQAILHEGIKASATGVSKIDIKEGMNRAVKALNEELNQQSKKVSGKDIANIATISANNDQEIGVIIAEAMEKVGKDGVITIEEAKGMETKIKLVEGMQFDRGYLSPYFVTNKEKMEVVMENPYIFLADKKITTAKELLPLLEATAQSGRPLLLIAEEIEGEAFTMLVLNKLRGALKVCAVKAPAFGDRRKAMLEDIALLTGGTLISEEKGYKVEETTIQHLGNAEKVRISKDHTVIINGSGNEEVLAARIKEIDGQIGQTDSTYEQEKLVERKANLQDGVAVIEVGGATEVEVKEKKDRFDDALNATRAALEEGIVPGGGIALLRAGQAVEKQNIEVDNYDQQRGVDIILRATKVPLRAILENGYGDQASEIFHKVIEGKGSYGYNARSNQFGDMLQEGVIDPKKVTRLCLENAASIVKLIIGTECVVANDPEEEKNTPAPSMPGGMGGMM